MVTAPPGLELELDTESAERLREIAFEEGAFVQSDSPIYRLSSGKLSKHYFDGRRITLSSRGAHHVARMVLDELSEIEVDAIGGPAIGAALIVPAVAAIADVKGKHLPTFVAREQPKEHGTQRRIEGHLKEGWRVAIVDDVITTGGSVFRAIDAVEEMGCKVVKVIVLVDRHEGGSDELKKRGYNFTAFLGLHASGDLTIEEPTVGTAT